jgi:hypothetical protein
MFSGLMSRWTRSKVYLVDGLQPCQELRGDVLGLLELERAALLQHLEQRGAVDVLHRYQLAVFDLDEVEDPAYVGGHHLTGGAQLLPQQLQPSFALEELGAQGLERHLDPELEIEGVPHLAHPTAAEYLENLVALAKYLAGGEGLEPLRQVEGRTLALGAGRRTPSGSALRWRSRNGRPRVAVAGSVLRHLLSRFQERV